MLRNNDIQFTKRFAKMTNKTITCMNNNSRNGAIMPNHSASKKYPTRSPNYTTLGRTVVTVKLTAAGYLNRREERRLILFLVCHGEHKSLNPTDAPPCRFTARISRSERMRKGDGGASPTEVLYFPLLCPRIYTVREGVNARRRGYDTPASVKKERSTRAVKKAEEI